MRSKLIYFCDKLSETFTVRVKKFHPCGFLTFFPNSLEFLMKILRSYYTFTFTLNYKFYSVFSNFDEVMPH